MDSGGDAVLEQGLVAATLPAPPADGLIFLLVSCLPGLWEKLVCLSSSGALGNKQQYTYLKLSVIVDLESILL